MVTSFSLPISIPFRSVTAPRRMAYRGGGSRSSSRGFAANDDLEAQDLVGKSQRPFELVQDLGFRCKLDDDVIALGLAFDLECQTPATPAIDLADLATRLADDAGDAVQRPGHDRLVGLRGQDEHAFVLPQFSTSSGLDGPHRGSRMCGCAQSSGSLVGRP